MREYGPGHPLVFSHIPKTAGTSLGNALRQSLQPSVAVVGLDTSLFGGYDDLDGGRPDLRADVYLSPEDLPADATLVAGHIAPATTMARYPGADHVTVLRLPQVRILSQWLHSRAVTEFNIRHWGPAAEAFRVGWLPLEDYLQHEKIAPNTDNTITRFLAWPHPLLHKTEFLDDAHDDELLAAALARLDTFGHVNVVENPQFVRDLAGWLGRELTDERLNERRSVPPRMRPDVLAEVQATRGLLDHRSRIDARVWAHVVGQVLPDADAGELLEATVQKALAGYVAMLSEPDQRPVVRKAVEGLYGVGVRLDPRRRAARR